jgi:hypothetical protein
VVKSVNSIGVGCQRVAKGHAVKGIVGSGKPYCKGSLCTINLLVLARLDKLLFPLNIIVFIVIKQGTSMRRVVCTEPSPSVRVPWLELLVEKKIMLCWKKRKIQSFPILVCHY